MAGPGLGRRTWAQALGWGTLAGLGFAGLGWALLGWAGESIACSVPAALQERNVCAGAALRHLQE